MSKDEEWCNVAAEVIYGLDILTAHFINKLSDKDLEHIWYVIDLMKKLMQGDNE